ncbi:hypothetical protein Pstr01_13590 [Pseudomonas straminea]|nr:hypothetical protein Pstr01_13590 [Pseudomonas straminea]
MAVTAESTSVYMTASEALNGAAFSRVPAHEKNRRADTPKDPTRVCSAALSNRVLQR